MDLRRIVGKVLVAAAVVAGAGPASPAVPAAPVVREEAKEPGQLVSEIRTGVLIHDPGIFSRDAESGVDLNAEVMFVSPRALRVLMSPRLQLGVFANTAGDTSQAYTGAYWEWTTKGGFFGGISLGASYHNGDTGERFPPDARALGCPWLFREAGEIGWRFRNGRSRRAITLMIDHVSNADLCSRNEGMELIGFRYGQRF